MKKQFDILKTNRQLVVDVIKNLSLEQLHSTPKNFNNNIVWNVAHLVVTQQLLHYKLSNLDCLIPDDLIKDYQKGTAPKQPMPKDYWNEVLELFLGLPNTLEEDYNEGIFKNYNSYKTSTGFCIETINDAISFNNYHEGIHLGSILALKRSI